MTHRRRTANEWELGFAVAGAAGSGFANSLWNRTERAPRRVNARWAESQQRPCPRCSIYRTPAEFAGNATCKGCRGKSA
jgi:hypothetical protein